MPPNEKRAKYSSYSQEALNAAFEAVTGGRMSIRAAALHFKIPVSTLGDKVRGKTKLVRPPRTELKPEEEAKIVEWVKERARRGRGVTQENIRGQVQSILASESRKTGFVNFKPSRTWFYRFMARHPEISKRKAQDLGFARAQVTEGRLKGWFAEAKKNLLEVGCDIADIDGSRIFSCDETGFPLNPGNTHVLAAKEDKKVYEVTGDSRQQITVLGCASATGVVMPPLIIYPGQRFTFDSQAQFPGSYFAKSKNGWIDGEIFQSWLRDAFIPFTSNLEKPVVLFVDGHASHISMAIHDLCKDNGVLYYTLPAHASHIVQPLDLVFDKRLKSEWATGVRSFRAIHGHDVRKESFGYVLKDVWDRAHAHSKISQGFAAAGLHPWNPDSPDYSKCAAAQTFAVAVPSLQPHQQPQSQPQTSSSSPPPTSASDDLPQECSEPQPSTSRLRSPSPPPTSASDDLPQECSEPQPSTSRLRSPSPPPTSESNKANSMIKMLVMVREWDGAKFFQIMRHHHECKCKSVSDINDLSYTQFNSGKTWYLPQHFHHCRCLRVTRLQGYKGGSELIPRNLCQATDLSNFLKTKIN